MLKALVNQGVSKIYVKIIKELYTGNKARIITDQIEEYFAVEKGVGQGDPL